MGVCVVGIGDQVADAVEALPPQGFELVEGGADLVQRVGITPNPLFATLPLLHDQTGSFQNSNMFLDGGEAHRKAPGELRHRMVTDQRQCHDLATRAIGERREESVGSLRRPLIYNHQVVR